MSGQRLTERHPLYPLRLAIDQSGERIFEIVRESVRAAMADWYEEVPTEAPKQHRPRLIPDFPTVYQDAISGLRADGVKLTWANVATRVAEKHPVYTGDPSTLRRWTRENHLPPPAKIEQLMVRRNTQIVRR